MMYNNSHNNFILESIYEIDKKIRVREKDIINIDVTAKDIPKGTKYDIVR